MLIVRATQKLLQRVGTGNRSVVGIMTEFSHLVEVCHDSNPDPDLLDLELWLATTPCGPLYGRNVSPDRELGALLRHQAPLAT